MLTPVAIESRANQLIKSASVPGADANSGIINPIQNFATVLSEARLDDSSPTDYYLVAAQGVTRLKWLTSTVLIRRIWSSNRGLRLMVQHSRCALMPEWHRLTGVAWSK